MPPLSGPMGSILGEMLSLLSLPRRSWYIFLLVVCLFVFFFLDIFLVAGEKRRKWGEMFLKVKGGGKWCWVS